MTNVTPEASGFGRLDWNVAQGVSESITTITNIITVVGVILEHSVIIHLAVDICQKLPYFRQPYFVIYLIYCFVDAFYKSMQCIYMIYPNRPLFYIYTAATWYATNFVTLCNLVLAVNRFSAIIAPLKFSKYWSKRNTAIVIVFFVIYPFIIHCFNLNHVWCTIDSYNEKCVSQKTEFETSFGVISDIVFSLLATFICSVAAFHMMCCSKLRNKTPEKVLLFQSITSSIFLSLTHLCAWFLLKNRVAIKIKGPEATRILVLQAFLSTLGSLFYSLHHYTGLLLLILMSATYRTKYMEFYKLDKVWKRIKKTKVVKSILKKVTKKNQVQPHFAATEPTASGLTRPPVRFQSLFPDD